jgi:3-hydroxybutyryl-CoA dehydrogenase
MSNDILGVVGAGVMGQGVAQCAAEHGLAVVLVDIAPAVLERARAAMVERLRFAGMFAKDKKTVAPPAEVLARVTFSSDDSALKAASFVIENVPERWEVKRQVLARLDALCPAGAIFASNTSAMPITALAAFTKRPSQVLGMHFMNPVPLTSGVEVVRGVHTADATIARGQELLARLGKTGIVVNDAAGFVINRVLMLTVNEAMFEVQEQVAPAEDVDRMFTTCLGHKMGPLALADLIGLDTVLYSLEVLQGHFRDDKFRPCPLLRQLVAAGHLGVKSGRGFFEYAAGGAGAGVGGRGA